MSDVWKELPGAPAEGTRVCSVDQVAPVASVELDGFPILVLQTARGLRAYFNACPHQYLPLDWRSAKILSPDGATLRCSNHDAGFDAATGQGRDGFGVGCALDPVPVRQVGGDIVIGRDG